MSDPETLFDIAAARSRFAKGPGEIERILQWHAEVTTELQRRVLEATRYVRSHNGDRKLLDILEGSHRPDELDQLVTERNIMTTPTPDLTPSELADVTRFGIHDEDQEDEQ